MSAHGRIRVLCVDDHPLIREGIAVVINAQVDMELVAQASNGQEAIKYFCEFAPDVTLMDLRLPDMSGIDAMIAIRNEVAEARVIILTNFEGDANIRRALASGARSYILKTMPPKDMLETIRRVHAGKKHIPPEVAKVVVEQLGADALTHREAEVLQLITAGNRNQDVAQRLFISPETVKVHIKHAREKLGASGRAHAVAIAARRGFIELLESR